LAIEEIGSAVSNDVSHQGRLSRKEEEARGEFWRRECREEEGNHMIWVL
jgi:hypothetical protein